MDVSREKTVCFTGHRPEKLDRPAQQIIEALDGAIDEAAVRGYDTFINGLARGVDLWAAELVVKKKNGGMDLKLVSAKPFDNYDCEWEEYGHVLDNSDLTVTVTEGWSDPEDDSAYEERDRWMVDRSSLVIAVYDGREGGTRNTIEYALKNGVEVQYL